MFSSKTRRQNSLRLQEFTNLYQCKPREKSQFAITRLCFDDIPAQLARPVFSCITRRMRFEDDCRAEVPACLVFVFSHHASSERNAERLAVSNHARECLIFFKQRFFAKFQIYCTKIDSNFAV